MLGEDVATESSSDDMRDDSNQDSNSATESDSQAATEVSYDSQDESLAPQHRSEVQVIYEACLAYINPDFYVAGYVDGQGQGKYCSYLYNSRLTNFTSTA
jgi:hypothetical protein